MRQCSHSLFGASLSQCSFLGANVSTFLVSQEAFKQTFKQNWFFVFVSQTIVCLSQCSLPGVNLVDFSQTWKRIKSRVTSLSLRTVQLGHCSFFGVKVLEPDFEKGRVNFFFVFASQTIMSLSQRSLPSVNLSSFLALWKRDCNETVKNSLIKN